MAVRFADSALVLRLFIIFLAASLAALLVACVFGRRWGDLSSRRHYGEALSEEELRALARARRGFLVWAGLSLVSAGFAFFALR